MRLTLKREALTALTDGELHDVAGGSNPCVAQTVTLCFVSNRVISVCDCLTRDCQTVFC